MTKTASSHPFTLERIDGQRWVISDEGAPASAARPLAHVSMTDDDYVEVIWVAPLPLPVTFATLADVLETLEAWSNSRRGATKPIPIPHFPPPAH